MGRIGRFIGSHRLVTGMVAAVAVAIGVGGWYVWDQVNVEDLPVLYIVPTAAQLAADGPDQSLYRVHPTRSTVGYEIDESLAGRSNTAVGTTQGIAGDIVIDEADASRSTFGEMVVNVQQLTSDETLRDRRLRHDFLESGAYPLARFVPTTVTGLPAGPITDRTLYDVTIDGELTVKDTTAPVTLVGTAERDDAVVRLQATADVLLSTWGIGPIELLGFVRTADETRLTFDITFVDPGRVTIPTSTQAPEVTLATAGDGPSFADTVAPILTENCASCHNAGGVGHKVWPLATAADAAEVASGLSMVTATRFMPPWPASDLSAPFAHDRSLTQDQIDAVVAWAAAGGPLDVDPDTPIVAPDADVPPVRADIVLASAEPYQGSTDRRDDYRCFVLDPQVTETTWVSGWEFMPDRTEIVHHAIGSRVPADTAAALRARDAADDGAGWYCGDLGMGGGSMQFMAWAPGQIPMRYRDGTALRIDPGDAIVVQVHYHFAHSAPADQSRVHLELAPAGSQPDEVTQRVFLAPAEIPCRAGLEEGPLCDRTAAIADIAARFGFGPSIIPDALVGRCGAQVADFAGMTDGRASASCTHTIFGDLDAISVFGHMHEIGDTFRMTLNPGTPGERILLDIPVWDFGWQIEYQFVEPVRLTRGDKLLVECSWDRAHLKVPEARYIAWSEGTVDEMCYSGLTTVNRRTG